MAVQMLSQQIIGLADLTGQSPEELWKSLGTSFEQGIPGDLSGVVEKPKRHYKRVQPDTPAKTHEVGHLAVDSMGRPHRVVMRKAFNGEIKAWKMVSDEELGTGDLLEVHQIRMSQVATKMGHPEYQDAAKVDLVLCGSDSPTTKRKYTSNKPEADPKSLTVGTTMNTNGLQWVVAEAKTSGNGKRQLWKRVDSVSPIASPDDSDSDSELEMGSPLDFNSDTVQNTPWLTVEDVDEAKAKRKYSSKKPEMPAKGFPIGTTTEANGIQWVVAEVKTRGDGKRQLWKRNESPSLEIELLNSSETPEPELEAYPDTKRKYTSRKPTIDPKELDIGTILESQGIRWVVSSAKTRGEGTRKLWKLSDPTSPSTPEPQMEAMANQLIGAVATPKKVRNSPTESANKYHKGDIQVGNDGRQYHCVERLRKAQVDGEEPKAYNVWQLAK